MFVIENSNLLISKDTVKARCSAVPDQTLPVPLRVRVTHFENTGIRNSEIMFVITVTRSICNLTPALHHRHRKLFTIDTNKSIGRPIAPKQTRNGDPLAPNERRYSRMSTMKQKIALQRSNKTEPIRGEQVFIETVER